MMMMVSTSTTTLNSSQRTEMRETQCAAAASITEEVGDSTSEDSTDDEQSLESADKHDKESQEEPAVTNTTTVIAGRSVDSTVVTAEPWMDDDGHADSADDSSEAIPTVTLPLHMSTMTTASPSASQVSDANNAPASLKTGALVVHHAWPVGQHRHDNNDENNGPSPNYQADHDQEYEPYHHDDDHDSLDHHILHDNNRDEPSRAQFLSVTVLKPTRDSTLGIDICQSSSSPPQAAGTRIQISGISSSGLLAASPLQVGDVLMSINHKTCVGMTVAGILQWIQKLKGTVTLVVCHEQGKPQLVESWIGISPQQQQQSKKSNSSLWGMRLREQPGTPPSVVIGSIQPNGLIAAASLCNVGDTIVSINGMAPQTVQQAASMLAQPQTPTQPLSAMHIVARTQAAVVLGTASRRRMKRLPPVVVEESLGELVPPIRTRSDQTKSARRMSNLMGLFMIMALFLAGLLNISNVPLGLLALAAVMIFGLINLPWKFRAPGKRCSVVQVICNLALLGFVVYMIAASELLTSILQVAGFVAFVVPLIFLVNLPSLVLDRGFEL